MMRALLTFCITGLLIAGCVLPASVKLGDQALLEQDYIKAVQHYEKALGETQDSQSLKQIEEKLASTKVLLVDIYLEKAKNAQAQKQNGAGTALNHALGILGEVAQWDDAEGRIAKQIATYSSEKKVLDTEIALIKEKSNKFIGLFQLDKASQEIEKGLAMDTANKSLLASKQNLNQMIASHALLGDMINKDDLQGTIDTFTQLSELSPVPLSLNNFPQRDDVVKLIKRESQKYQTQDKWWTAYSFLTQWDIPQLQSYVKQVQKNGANHYYQAARQAMSSGNSHKGFLLIERALILNNRNLNIFNLNRELGDLVNRSMQSNIAIASFDSPSNDRDAGKQFSDSLISYLYEVLPYGINILERDKIDYVLKEKTDGEKELAQILGVDLMVTGTVSLFKVDKVVDERAATVKVKSGEQVVQNPEFNQMLQVYGPNPTMWPKDLPPRTITKEVFQLVKYNKGQAELKGFSKVSVRIFDTHKGAIAFVKDYDANVKYASEFQDELAEANIEYIPMKLPTDTEAKEEMRKEIVQQIGTIVQSSFENREARFLNQARFYLERKQNELAYKPLAEGYLYCMKEGIKPDNPSFKEINRIVATILD